MNIIKFLPDKEITIKADPETIQKLAQEGNKEAINELIDKGDLDIQTDTIKILKMILGRV